MSTLFAVLFLLAPSAAPTSAPASAPTADWPPPAAPPPAVELTDEAFPRWLAARLAAARKGDREIVRVPVVWRSVGWGCDCPDVYLGTEANVYGPGPWLDVQAAPGVELPPAAREGTAVMTEGRFTGTARKLDLQPEGEHIPELLYTLEGFEILRLRPLRPDDADATGQVVLRAADLATAPPSFADDHRWLVIAGTARLPGRTDDLQKRRDALLRAGFAEAELFDSRRAPALFVGYRILVVGRYATQPEAAAIARDARRRHFEVYVKPGW